MRREEELPPSTEGGDEGKAKLPPIGEPVWVQCNGFRIKAFHDGAGRWRTLGRQELLTGVVKVIEGM
jgi:hypothetical protein